MQSLEMESINQSSNHSEKKDHVLLEINCVELTENQNTDETCAPPNLQGNEDDNKKSKYKYNGASSNDAKINSSSCEYHNCNEICFIFQERRKLWANH